MRKLETFACAFFFRFKNASKSEQLELERLSSPRAIGFWRQRASDFHEENSDGFVFDE